MYFKLLTTDAKMPTRGTYNSAGYDIYALEDVFIDPLEKMIINTGISAEINPKYYLKVASRSGLAFKHGITAFHGTIDPDYKDEIKILLFNQSNIPYIVNKGAKIAQLILTQYSDAIPAVIENLERNGGFGSTGR